MKIISDSELKSVTTVIVIDDMFDTCGSLAWPWFFGEMVMRAWVIPWNELQEIWEYIPNMVLNHGKHSDSGNTNIFSSDQRGSSKQSRRAHYNYHIPHFDAA